MSNTQLLHASVDDGHKFEVIAVIPPGAKYSLMWASAMGVAARNYLPLAHLLAQQGIAVFLHEWRGIGSSNWRASRQCDWSYRQLLELDMLKTFEIIEQCTPNAQRIIGGHSLGGQLASCFAGWVPRSATAGLWLVCTGSPYFRTFPFPHNYGVFASYVLLPGLATLNGHLPGKALRFAGNEARSVLRDWARTALTGKYQVRTMMHDFDALMARNPVPVTGVIMAKDWLAPRESMAFLQNKFQSSAKTLTEFTQSDGSYEVDHFSWMKSPQQVADALLASLPAS